MSEHSKAPTFSRAALHKARLAGITLEVFEWYDEHGQNRTLYNVSAIRAAIAANPGEYNKVETLVVNIGPFVLEHRDYDISWAKALTEEQRDEPIIAIVETLPGGGVTHTLIDGTHRAVRRLWDELAYQEIWEVPADKAIYVTTEQEAEYFKPQWGKTFKDGKLVDR